MFGTQVIHRELLGQMQVYLINLLQHFGFEMRIKGSHHIFRKDGIEEKPNLQMDGNKAKPYQVKQIRNIIIKYKLG